MRLQCGRHILDLDAPVVMGVLNVTPDSFSDGGDCVGLEAALAHAMQLADEGAAIIDVGGESTRPGAAPVSADEELRRVIPVIGHLARRLPVPVSVDTSKPEVMRAAIAAGASMVNDVRALRSPGALEAVAGTGVAICLMHMQGEPGTMQSAPRYTDVLAEVREFLRGRVQCCAEAGIALSRLVISHYVTAAHNAANQWLERSLDDSANRRVLLPQSFLTADGLCVLARSVACGLVVNRRVIERGVRRELPYQATETILMEAVRRGGDRQELHERLRQLAFESRRLELEEGEPRDLVAAIAADPVFRLSLDEARKLCDANRFIGRAPAQVDRFLAEHVAPFLERHPQADESLPVNV